MQRVLVAEQGSVAMVARNGCVAMVRSAELEPGATDELRIRCPRPERLASWFTGLDKLTANVALQKVDVDAAEPEDEDVTLPAAELVTASGAVLRVTEKNDAARLAGEVRALSAELAAAEVPSPGPASRSGWQMLHVSGPAHVFFAGHPAKGVLDARVSTSGQYFCEFVTSSEEPLRATKSGWISPDVASRAIDEVLGPFEAIAEGEQPRTTTYASATNASGERKANAAATAEVFERFSPVQDALGDACLPELDTPSAPTGL